MLQTSCCVVDACGGVQALVNQHMGKTFAVNQSSSSCCDGLGCLLKLELHVGDSALPG